MSVDNNRYMTIAMSRQERDDSSEIALPSVETRIPQILETPSELLLRRQDSKIALENNLGNLCVLNNIDER